MSSRDRILVSVDRWSR